MSVKPYVTVFLVILILANSFLVVLSVNSQPTQGNWVVTGIEVIENQTIILNGNLIVRNGGNLTLINVILIMNCLYRGQYSIGVDPGATLHVYRCNISSANPDYRYAFNVEGDGFILRDSSLQGVGWCTLADDPYWGGTFFIDWNSNAYGLRLEGDNGLIENNYFTGNFIDLGIFGSNIRVRRNIFDSTGLGAVHIMDSSSNTCLFNNTFRKAPSVSSAVILSSTIISSAGSNVIIANNTLKQTKRLRETAMAGIFTRYISNVTIENNTISTDVGIQIMTSINMVIKRNNITYVEVGIFSLEGVNNRIERNILQAPIDSDGRSIGLTYCHGSMILNNNSTTLIYLENCYNNSILNNYVESGLLMLGCNDNTISNNNFSGKVILYSSSDRNHLTYNDFRTMEFVMDGSSSNILHHNNFLLQQGSFYFDNAENIWHFGSQGNYWSVYNGSDTNNDGVGDSPFFISPLGIDSSPLMMPVNVAQVDIKGMVYLPLSDAPVSSKGIFNWDVEEIRIENQFLELESGNIWVPSGHTLVIRNSTLVLGEKGSVEFGASGGSLIVEDSVIKKAEIGYGFQMAFQNLTNLLVKGSELRGASWALGGGLSIDSADKIIIEDSLITGSFRSLFLHNIKTSRIVNNSFTGNVEAMIIGDSNNIIIANNTIYDALNCAITLFIGNQGTLHNITIEGNIIYRSWENGIQIWCSLVDSKIKDNWITNCKSDGLILTGRGAIVYHNNFINNRLYADDRGTDNVWSYNGEGNYWSGYNGNDANFDGIGDTLFVINEEKGLGDNFPFMHENGWLTKFYLTVQTNYPSIPFSVSKSKYNTGVDGTKTLRLGYVRNYEVEFHKEVTVSDNIILGFDQWADGVKSLNRIFNLSSNTTIQANYHEQDLVKVISEYGEVSGRGWYDKGSEATISIKQTTISVDDGIKAVFTGWTGDHSGSSQQATLTVSKPLTIEAGFRKQYLLNVESEFSETSGSGWYDEGTKINFSIQDTKISVNPLISKVFRGWFGDSLSPSQSDEITIDSPKTIIAVWADDYTNLYLVGGIIVIITVVAVTMVIRRK